MYALGRPQRWQRRTVLELNLGFLLAFWTSDVFAIVFLLSDYDGGLALEGHPHLSQ